MLAGVLELPIGTKAPPQKSSSRSAECQQTGGGYKSFHCFLLGTGPENGC